MRETYEKLAAWKGRYLDWLQNSAFDLWWNAGADHSSGGFHEVLCLDGQPLAVPRRARVQARQSYVYALSGQLGWSRPWRDAALWGLDYLDARYRRADGLYCTLVSAEGTILDPTVMLYDQAFVLMASATVCQSLPARADLEAFAVALLERIFERFRHSAGRFKEAGERPFLSNPHMHLLEAALAWVEISSEPVWGRLADEIVELCLTRFVNAERKVLLEYFDAQWNAAAGEAGECVEPGHQFEWAWLLERWSRRRGNDVAHATAVQLFAAGTRGVDPQRHVACDELGRDFTVRRASARLWPQTERLKAALILSQTSDAEARASYLGEACSAAEGLWGYLQVPTAGLWRDKLLENGSYIDEPAPASSFYHIACAIASLSKIGEPS